MKKRILSLLLGFIMFLNMGLGQVNANTISFEGVEKIIKEAIADKVTPGMQIVITKGDKIVYSKAFGTLDEKTKVENDTIYDLASVTKVMATTQAVMKLVAEGKLDLEATVATYLPEFAQNGKEAVKVKELLNHTSGLTPWKPSFFYASNPKEELEYICKLPLEYKTGTARKYSDFSFMTLGYLVEAITGKTLKEYTEEEIFKPLGMKHTVFTPLKENRGYLIAPTSLGNPFEYKMVADDNFGYKCEENADDFKGWRNYRLQGEVNDGNAWYAQQGVAGHAGLFANAEDLSILTRLMLNNGSLGKVTLYDKKIVETFTTVQSDFGHGYGFEINRGGASSGYMGIYADENVFGHTGFTGTQFVVDKRHGISVIILTNKQFFGVNEKGNYKSTWPVARGIMKAIYESGLITFSGNFAKAQISYNGKREVLNSFVVEDRNYVLVDDFMNLVADKTEYTLEVKENGKNVPLSVSVRYKDKQYPVKAFRQEDKVYVHIRDLVSMIGKDIKWDGQAQIIEISQKETK